MFSILGGAIRYILSPVTKLIFTSLYGLLIRGPLTVLNIENHIINFASGGYTDKLLFDTSIMDGKPSLNFFASSSPLKPVYMMMISASSILVVLFIGFSIASTFFGKKGDPKVFKKMGQVLSGGSAVFFVPTIFLTLLSLTGGLITAINGKNQDLGNKDISRYKQYTSGKMQQLINGSYDSDSFNKTISSIYSGELYSNENKSTNANNYPSQPMGGKANPIPKTINELYDLIIDPQSDFKYISSDIKTKAQDSKEKYKDLNDIVVEYNNGQSLLKQSINDQIVKVDTIVNKLTPRYKNELEKDAINDLLMTLQTIQHASSEWVESVKELNSYIPLTIKTDQDAALANLRTAFKQIWGDRSSNSFPQQITTFQDLNDIAGLLQSGDPQNASGSLVMLKQQISDFQDSALVVTFYQVVTGNKDANWNRSFSSLKNGGTMLLIGFFMIIASIIMLASIIIECFLRIVILALLFVISPLFITTIFIDNGARMKTWINVVVGQLISVFGIILILRFGFVLEERMADILDSAKDFSGTEGYLIRSVSLALFAYSVLVGSMRSRSIILQISGSNQGVLSVGQDALQAGRRIFMGGRGTGRIVGRALGLGGWSSGAAAMQASGDTPQATMGRMDNFKATWSRRARKPLDASNKAIVRATKGKLGSTNQRNAYFDNKASKLKAKQDKFTYKKSGQKKIDHRNAKTEAKKGVLGKATQYKADKESYKSIKKLKHGEIDGNK